MGGGPLGLAPPKPTSRKCASKCVFTTHTPVPAGHDRFSTEQAIRILGGERTARLETLGCFDDGMLNMTLLALRFSRYANGVAMQHGKVSRAMFPEYQIDSITNGVHAPTWVSEPVQQMLDAQHSRMATRQSLPAQCHRSSRAGDADRASPRQRRLADRGGDAHRPGAQSQCAHAGLCAPRRHLQARQPAVHRSGTLAEDCQPGRRPADSLRRQGASARTNPARR